ncbi:F-box/kelch-repeat protein At3g06240-like [Pyrus communis]|uniref:F-box/kelch-repeat protein At3g06240-like n=1 Tax=Pyrus communis TaxID=23211 RepID=UPI0035C22790
MALQSLQYDGNSLEKSRHNIVSQVMFRRHKYSFHLDFVFFNLICLKDGTDGSRCLLLNPLKGEAMMLPTMLPSVQVPENLNPKSFEYWYGMGFDNTTNTYKIVRVYGCKIAGIFGRLVSEYLVYVLGTSSWKEIDSVPSREIIIDKKVSAYRDMHWLTLRLRRVQAVIGHSISILSFDLKKEKFRLNIPNPPFRKKPGSFPPIERFQLINLSGSLSLVDASSNKYLGIWMLKNYDEKGWILGYSRGQYTESRKMSSIEKGIGYERAQLYRWLDFPKKLWESGGTENKYEGS